MDCALLLNALVNSIGTDADSRKSAQSYLDSIKESPGLIPALVNLSLSDQAFETRLLSVIFLKNTTKVWRDSSRSYALPPEDKDYLRLNILNCLSYSIPEKIRTQFEEIAYNIASVDFPWDQIIIQIEEAFQQNTSDSIYAALMMIFQIGRTFEFTMSKKRKNLQIIVSSFFPKLEALLGSFLSGESLDSFRFASLVINTYWVCTYIDIFPEQSSPPVLSKWLVLFKKMIEMPVLSVPDEGHPFWQCKKWSMQLLHRFFSRYFNAAHLKDHLRVMSEHFLKEWTVPILSSVLPQLLSLSTQPVTPIYANYLIKYATQSLKYDLTSPMIQECSSKLIHDVVMVFLKREPNEEQLWNENPIEFIRKEADLSRAFYSPKNSSIDLLCALCEKGALLPFLTYAASELMRCDLQTKEALLLAIGSLHLSIKEDTQYAQEMENLLKTYVLPEMDSSVGFLRARASWMYGQFASFHFSDVEHQNLVLQKMCALTLDSELPVKVESAISIPKLLCWEISIDKIGNEIKQLLEIYLGIMSQIDSEELVDSLEEIVSTFSSQILPFAFELLQHLINHFMKLVATEREHDHDDMGIVSTLNTIGKIIDTIEGLPEELLRASFLLFPLFEWGVKKEGCDYFEEIVHIFNCLVYYAPDQYLPHLFPLMGHIKTGITGDQEHSPYTSEHVDETFSLIGNFISKYSQLSKENIDIFSSILSVLFNGSSKQVLVACKISMALLESLASIDALASSVITQIITYWNTNDHESLRKTFLQVLSTSFHYNTDLTFQILQNNSLIEFYLQYLTADLNPSQRSETMSHFYGLGSFLLSNHLMTYPVYTSSLGSVFLKLYSQMTTEKEEGSLIEKLKKNAFQDEDSFGYENEDLYDSALEKKEHGEFAYSVIERLSAATDVRSLGNNEALERILSKN